MATKTLSVDEEAYMHLIRAKTDAKESFSKVIKRARWDSGQKRCSDMITRVKGVVDEKILDRLDRVQSEDAPPSEPWLR